MWVEAIYMAAPAGDRVAWLFGSGRSTLLSSTSDISPFSFFVNYSAFQKRRNVNHSFADSGF
jgi:hypothetical protein